MKNQYRMGLLALLLSSGAVQADGSEALRVVVPAQPIAAAINELSRQSGLYIVIDSRTARGVVSNKVEGTLTAEAALVKLLENTGLKFEYLGENAVAVVREEEAGAAVVRGEGVRVARSEAGSLGSGDGLLGVEEGAGERQEETQSIGANKTANNEQEAPTNEDLEEVVITGSNIRGGDSAGSKVIVIDREYIEESGYATVQDILKTLPQNFGGGVGEDNFLDTNASESNYNRGTALNLRGLGVDSTLVLVNGRRQPSSGTYGSFIDVSSIAASAVERIEVLPDGASAVYGSDAVGGVVNFILRRDYEGFETRLRYGSFSGDAEDLRLSQLAGTKWTTGNVLAGYQYYKRDNLARVDRPYTASNNLTRFGGSDFRGVQNNPGNILCPRRSTTCIPNAPVFAIPAGQDGTNLPASDLLPGAVNYNEGSEQVDFLPSREEHSAFLNLRQNVTGRSEVFLEARYSTRDMVHRRGGRAQTLTVPQSNPFFVDPFGGQTSVRVAYNFLDDFGPMTGTGTTDTYAAASGIDFQIADTWRLVAAASHGREKTYWKVLDINLAALDAALADSDPLMAFNPFGDGSHTNPETLEALRDSQIEDAKSRVSNLNITADGALFDLPGGTVRLAVGGDYRYEKVVGKTISQFESPPLDMTRDVIAGFVEMSLPLVSNENNIDWLDKLELSLAGRREEYNDFGSTFDKKIGLTIAPVSALSIRGTWGTSFKAPRLIELMAQPPTSGDIFLDLASPDGNVNTLVRLGNNPDLQPETARVWTAGVDLDLSVYGIPQSLSLTYYSIDYSNRIAPAGPTGNPFGVLLDSSEWESIIIRSPTQAQVSAICNGPLFLDTGVPCDAATTHALVDLRLRNLSRVNVRGIDLGASYLRETQYGALSLGVDGTYVLDFNRAVTETSPEVETVDTVGNVPSLRLRGSVEWQLHKRMGINAFVNYVDALWSPVELRTIPSWTTVDLSVTYKVPVGSRMSSAKLALSAVNVLDRLPPFVNAPGRGYDSSNANLYGRVMSIQVVTEW